LTRPTRFLNRMVVFLAAVALACALIGGPLYRAFMGNPALNGIILGALLVGVLYIFRQVFRLNPEVAWLEGLRRREGAVATGGPTPRLLSPIAAMLDRAKGGRVNLSPMALRTLLDGISSRLDEQRDISRYFIGLLVFLGLLGTFYGLLETLGAVAEIIGTMQIGGGDIGRAFNELKAGLQAPLQGMGTAFSASLFGLAGSLVLGFLDLQAGQAQNRFYNDLEEWLSGFTRLSGGGSLGDAGDTPIPAYIQALLEQTADSLDGLQRIMARGEESRIGANNNLLALTDRLSAFTSQMETQQRVLNRLAEPGHGEEAVRGHLRNIELYLGRIAEDMAQGRAETIQEMRSEIRLLARTIAALAEESERS
jgi:hypothetical protein